MANPGGPMGPMPPIPPQQQAVYDARKLSIVFCNAYVRKS